MQGNTYFVKNRLQLTRLVFAGDTMSPKEPVLEESLMEL
eukprot:gene18394-23497_t